MAGTRREAGANRRADHRRESARGRRGVVGRPERRAGAAQSSAARGDHCHRFGIAVRNDDGSVDRWVGEVADGKSRHPQHSTLAQNINERRFNMKDAVIVDGVRTPVGNHGGALRSLLAKDLLTLVFKSILERTKIDPASIDEVIAGCIAQPSDAPNIARVSALMAGVPKETPALTVARNCNSGMDAIVEAWRGIQLDEGDIYLVGGVEGMSNIPYIIKDARWGLKIRHSQLTDALWEGLTDPICGQLMGRTAENLADEFEITRQQQDEFAVQSHKKAFAATRMGKFKDEIVPAEVVKKVAGQEVAREQITQDETINAGLSVQKAAMYPTIFKKEGGS